MYIYIYKHVCKTLIQHDSKLNFDA